MDTLLLESTNFTPKISFDVDSLNFEISGISRPEDVLLFYEPILKWLDDFYEEDINKNMREFKGRVLKFIFKFIYFNSASAKYILRILDRIEKINLKGVDVHIDWYYDKEDEQMKEDGEDLSDAVSISFNFLPF